MSKKWIPYLLAISTFIYYALLAVKSYSWIFTSSDSGIWLAAATQWIVPPPYGGPIYLLLGHLVHFLFASHLPAAMTVLLSALPAAISVALVYLIVLKLTSKVGVSVISSLVLASCCVFLTEGTVTIYHVLGATFLIAGLYTYLLNKRYLTALLLGLGIGVHVMIAPIALLWLLVERNWRNWWKPVILLTAIVILSYSVILLLMYLPTPRLLAGGMSVAGVRSFFTQTSHAIVGQMSIFEAPRRILITIEILLACFGVSLIPAALSFKRPYSKATVMCLAAFLFATWYFATCLDVMTWTYLAFAAPTVAVLVGLGLSKLSKLHYWAVIICSLTFLILNPIFMNANALTNENPIATQFFSQLDTLPYGSIVVTNAGGLSLGLFYYDTLPNRHIMPLIYGYIEHPQFYPIDYPQYITDKYYPLNYTSTLTAIQSAIDDNIPVYYTEYYGSVDFLRQCFNLEHPEDSSKRLARIISLTGLEPAPTVIMLTKGY